MDKQRNHFLFLIASLKVTKIIFFLLVIMITLPIINHYYLSRITKSNKLFDEEIHIKENHNQFSLKDVSNEFKIENLQSRLNEIRKIRESVLNELVYLESKRQKQQEEITNFTIKLEEIKTQINRKQNELKRILLSLEQAEYTQKEAIYKNRPLISAPLKIVSNNFYQINLTSFDVSPLHLENKIYQCNMHNCFDYSKCHLIKKLNVFLLKSFLNNSRYSVHIENDLIQFTYTNFNLVNDINKACLIILPIFNEIQLNELNQSDYLNKKQNILVINFLDFKQDIKLNLNFKSAMFAQNNFNLNNFNNNFDLIIPSIKYVNWLYKKKNSNGSIFKRHSHCPAKRKYLLSCVYNINGDDLNNFSKSLIRVINTIFNNSGNHLDSFYFDFNYENENDLEGLRKIYSESTFSIILPPDDLNAKSSQKINTLLSNILSVNCIPVILGKYHIELPFNEVIDWNLATVFLPAARTTELHYILKSFNDNDILQMKKYGKLFYDRYLSNVSSIISSIFSIIKTKRLQMPLNVFPDAYSNQIYKKSNLTMQLYKINNEILENSNDIDENLGPIEPPISSIAFQRNFSLVLVNNYLLWNSEIYNPFYMFPYTPFDPVLPSEAKFKGSNYGFRPIKNGLGGSGKEFSESLGGNYQKEQFTIVMLTFERDSILINSLQKLKGLPYLNKVVIVWNSNRLPSLDLKWPDIGVEIEVIKSEKNSLNNRFKPYDVITTEAILSIDDDVHLRHDEIIFGFRVWRESRDQIVGFPGRYHAWMNNNNEWLYNSNYSCELSMVLTGAAFFHKYYAYVYSELMDSKIRKKIDDYMNCEDIAMNFLVSHLTRKPPLKVTSRWTFRCPTCPISLSEDDSHFEERHKCINYFTYLYGYNPLLYTQYRADSVLFKTRIPQNKQKCFKLI